MQNSCPEILKFQSNFPATISVLCITVRVLVAINSLAHFLSLFSLWNIEEKDKE